MMIQLTIRRHDLFPHPKSLLMHKCKRRYCLDAPGIVDFGFEWNSDRVEGSTKRGNSDYLRPSEVLCHVGNGFDDKIVSPIHKITRNAIHLF